MSTRTAANPDAIKAQLGPLADPKAILIERAYRQHRFSTQEIAEHFGIPESAVYNTLVAIDRHRRPL